MKNILRLFAICILSFGLIFGLTGCGSKEETIKVYTRDQASGTRNGFFLGIGFDEAEKDNTPLVKGYIEVLENGSMISSIKNDENGIGYISLSTLEGSSLKGLAFNGVNPTEENILNGTYALKRNFNYCIRESYSNDTNRQIVEAFIAYLGTIEGKSTIVEKGGIISVNSSDPSWVDIKDNYPVASLDNSNITIKIGGSTSVNSMVKALMIEFSSKCGNFQFEQNATGSGDAYKRTNGSEKDGPNACDIGFASREFKSNETMNDSLKGQMCIDAIVVVVNSKNKVNAITAEEVKKIYDGTITTWSKLAD